jgi:hypothetical protein
MKEKKKRKKKQKVQLDQQKGIKNATQRLPIILIPK